MQLDTAFQQRLKAWDRLQQGEERHTWDIRPWLTDCIRTQAVFEAMARSDKIVNPVSPVDGWAAVALFSELTFFGLYGALRTQLASAERETHIAEMIDKASRLIAMAPANCNDEIPNKIIALANARRQLDTGAGFINARGLALLGGISEGRVRNMLSEGHSDLISVGGKIPVEKAIKWLGEHPWRQFWPSLGQEDEARAAAPEIVQIPRATDGSVFHPALRRRNGYMIGAKGSEIVVAGFDEALAMLSRMPEARWRRPNPQGNWGIVKAVAWKPIERKELDRIRLE